MGLRRWTIIFLLIFTEYFETKLTASAQGCSVGDGIRFAVEILDVHEGIIFNLETSGVIGFTVAYGQPIRDPPYFDMVIEDSRFLMTPNERFSQYEENEISSIIDIITTFRCSDGTDIFRTFTIQLIDTNNHAPVFIPPPGHYHYVLDAPTPPGYHVTGCLSDLIARDVDLTTEKIIFEIEENPFFSITYSAEMSIDGSKEFKAIVTTKTFVRNFPQEMTLHIKATDVHGTPGQGVQTTNGQITITGNKNFVLPDEPVFSKTIYTGIYTTDLPINQVVLDELISLQHGYDDLVRFSIDGPFKDNFKLVPLPDQVNQIRIEVVVPLEEDYLLQESIALEIIAEREFTSGTSATVILQLPRVVPLKFERAHYEGTIENNVLHLPPLLLSQGYEDSIVSADFVLNEYSEPYIQAFRADVQEGVVTVSMSALDQTVIDQNNFIYLQIEATATSGTATSVITLEIIKDDNVTPVFEKPIYTGSYEPGKELIIEQISFSQGYDGVDSLLFDGEHKTYFAASRNGPHVTIEVSNIPPELFNLGRIELSLQATKPRTVGATTTVIVTLPAVVPLKFERAHYEGTIENNVLHLPPLLLSQGYEDSIVSADFVLNEYSEPYIQAFRADVQEGVVTVSMSALDQTVIDQNNFIYLQIEATATSGTATSVITLEIIKDDNVTPVFEKPIYTGSYEPGKELIIEQISFSQGYDGVDSLLFDGEHKTYFAASRNGPHVTIEVSNIPPELFNLGRIELSLQATKPRTVGATTTVIVTLPAVVPLKFERAHYEGTIENNVLHLPPLLLSQGYEDSIVSADFVLNEYSEPYIQAFIADVQEGVVTVSMSALDQTVIDQNNFIYLQIEATATSGTATSVITLEIIKDDNVTPVFEKPIYTGSYEPGKELIIEQISFSQGYDGVDSLLIDGEHKTFFAATRNGPHVTIGVSNIPPELFSLGRIELSLQATKPRTVGATTTVIVTLPAVVPLKFERAHYEGTIENNVLHLPPLLLSQGYEDSIVSADFVLNEYSEPYIQAFTADVQEGVVTVSMSALDQTVIDQNNFIYLQIEATATSGTATSVITLEIIKDDNVTPVFEKPIYTGSYEPGKELIIEQISFSQGYDGVDSLLIDGEHKTFFAATRNGPHVTIGVSNIPPELFSLGRIELSLQATKPRTVGATTTVIVTLPAVVPLKFERAHYEGTIENNVLHLPPLLLSQGYEDSIVSADFVLNEYSEPYIQAFRADVQEGVVTVSMSALDQTVIDQNNFIYLQIEATATSGTATSVITLEIIKDDNVTPVFEKPIYTGSYEPGKELIIEQISFSQGYDGVDSLLFDGEHKTYFAASRNGPHVTIEVSNIPPELFNLGRIELSLQATKPRTVGATTTVIVTLPAVVPLKFERAHYEGTIENNVLHLPPLLLSQGYEDSIVSADFVLNEYSEPYIQAFRADVQEGVVTVSMSALDQTVIDQNNFIYLQIEATATSGTATSVITLEIIKDDNVTPVFEKPIYTGSYEPGKELIIEQISFSQGYDGVDSLLIDGEHKTFFAASRNGPHVTIEVSNIPPELFSLGRIELSLQATKPRTVGATTAVIITLPAGSQIGDDVYFERVLYEGTVQDNDVQHEEIRIFGFGGTSVELHGENSNLFKAEATNGLVSVRPDGLLNLPPGITRVALELHVGSARAVLLLNVKESGSQIGDDVYFERVLYEGTVQDNDVQHEEIRIFGFGGTSVELHGENSNLFKAEATNGLVSVRPDGLLNLPPGITRVALELHVGSARAVLLLNVKESGSQIGDDVYFERVLYEGTVQDNDVQHEEIRIFGFDGTSVELHGENSNLFKAEATNGLVSVRPDGLLNLPPGITRVALELHVGSARAVLLLNVKESGSQIGDDVYFERVLYEGTVQDNDVQHEEIRIFGFDGTSVELHGENSNLFKAEATNGLVSVRPDGSLNLPPGITRVALELHVGSARAVLLLNVKESGSQIGDDVYFERVLYEGTVQDNDVQHEEIRIFGFDGTSVELHGENSNLFKAEATNGLVSVRPDGLLNLPPGITRVALELHVGSARAVLLLNVKESGSQIGDDVYFERVLYEGTVQDNDVQHEEIRIFGFDGTSVELHGENSNLFKAEATNGLVSVRPDGLLNLPPGITRVALELHVGSARAVLLLNVKESGSQIGDDVYFERVLYEGTVQDNDVQHEEIRIFGFDGTSVELHGENSNLFKAEATNGLVSVRPDGSLNLPPGITRVALELHVGSARAVLLLNVRESGSQIGDDVYFERVLYEGTVQDNDVQHEEIRIFGFDGTSVELHGENSNLFKAEATNGLVSVRPDGSLNLPPGITRVALELHVGSARAVLLLNVRESGSQIGDDVYFERVLYEGTVRDNDVQHEEIRIFGFDGTSVELHGENSNLFKAEATNGLVSVRPDGSLNLPPGITRVALELHVGSARAVLLLNVRESGSQIGDDVYFERVLYEGTVRDNDVQHEEIRIFGFDGTSVELHGENSNLFKAEATNGLVSVRPDGSLNLPPGITRVALELHVGSARAVLLLNVRESGSQIGDDVYFERVLYEGTVQDNDVQHEEIRIFGFDGTSVELHGENSYLFKAEATNGLVSVRPDGLLNLPPGITRVALELHVGSARAVLLLNVRESEVPGPSVEFSSESYAVSISSTQTGLVGRVSATASNNEAIAYSLSTDNAHLVSRLSINNEGELHLSTPADSGVYTFQVIAATVNSEAMATATVHLTVQATTVCDDRGIVVPPLIVIDKDEEEEHRNLVVLDPTQHEGCRYTMTSRWPTQQTWLYADETGLHARAIDREDKSIAFMTVSQVQVELMLQCDNDPVRTKRSIRSYDWLDPYEYGSNQWILTESIPYNSRRTLVNLIVNDINDNAPIFVGKENEPIAVGYPNGELEERILPRSLAELQATDADIGINAAIRYSSSESVLAVAPTTGFVHVRSGASLQHDQILTVTATDQNGEGLSGNIQLIVKLLDINHIAVVTVRDVFLDDEKTVLARLSDAVGYEVKVLRSVVVSDDINEDVSRQKRETNPRTSLQLFVYGLVQQEPVVVSQLASDLNSQAVIQNIATIPLETHLENGNMALQSTVGLLVATIVLSVLLFAALCVIAVWFFLSWRKNRNYNQFSDDASLASARNASLGELTKPEEVRPRLNIEELKRSEKRLQERLAQVTPMEQVTVEPMPRQLEPPAVAILDVPVPEHNTPIVIQSIDKLKDADDESDNDEFGEVKKARRKSVVTFNENVEKIIHVQDDVEESEGDGILTVDSGDAGSSSTDDITVYRL